MVAGVYSDDDNLLKFNAGHPRYASHVLQFHLWWCAIAFLVQFYFRNTSVHCLLALAYGVTFAVLLKRVFRQCIKLIEMALLETYSVAILKS